MEHDAFSREKIGDTKIKYHNIERLDAKGRCGITDLMNCIVSDRENGVTIEKQTDHTCAECACTVELQLSDEMLTLIIPRGTGDIPFDLMKNVVDRIPLRREIVDSYMERGGGNLGGCE